MSDLDRRVAEAMGWTIAPECAVRPEIGQMLGHLYRLGFQLSANFASHGVLIWKHAQKPGDRCESAFGETLHLALSRLVIAVAQGSAQDGPDRADDQRDHRAGNRSQKPA